jgi:lipoprotein-releasing system ATP-binding protein
MILSATNISKSFPQRGKVLDSLQLEVNEGDTVAIMGPSGSGKTTLLNIFGLLEKPDTGDIYYKGISTARFSDSESAIYRNRNIGFVFQDHLLLPHLTVWQNIILPLIPANYKKEEFLEKEDNLRKLMERIGISDLSLKLPSTISGGEAQRVALVRAMANNPSIILADEPTGSLDSANAKILGELLTLMNNDTGITIILATHSADLASKMKKGLKLESGKLL